MDLVRGLTNRTDNSNFKEKNGRDNNGWTFKNRLDLGFPQGAKEVVVDAYCIVYSYVKLTDCINRRLGSGAIYLRDFLIQFLHKANRPDHYGEGSKGAREKVGM